MVLISMHGPGAILVATLLRILPTQAAINLKHKCEDKSDKTKQEGRIKSSIIQRCWLGDESVSDGLNSPCHSERLMFGCRLDKAPFKHVLTRTGNTLNLENMI